MAGPAPRSQSVVPARVDAPCNAYAVRTASAHMPDQGKAGSQPPGFTSTQASWPRCAPLNPVEPTSTTSLTTSLSPCANGCRSAENSQGITEAPTNAAIEDSSESIRTVPVPGGLAPCVSARRIASRRNCSRHGHGATSDRYRGRASVHTVARPRYREVSRPYRHPIVPEAASFRTAATPPAIPTLPPLGLPRPRRPPLPPPARSCVAATQGPYPRPRLPQPP